MEQRDATLGWFYDSAERNDPPTGRVLGEPYGVCRNPHGVSNRFSHWHRKLFLLHLSLKICFFSSYTFETISMQTAQFIACTKNMEI